MTLPVFAAYRYEQEHAASLPVYSWGVVEITQLETTGEVTATLLCNVPDDETGGKARLIASALNAS